MAHGFPLNPLKPWRERIRYVRIRHSAGTPSDPNNTTRIYNTVISPGPGMRLSWEQESLLPWSQIFRMVAVPLQCYG